MPTISGTVKVGSTLTASAGAWGPAPVTLTYQWNASDVAISGATSSTFTVTDGQMGKTLTVTVKGAKTGFTTVSKTSAATVAAPALFTSAPAPVISGRPVVGTVLTAVPGTWGPSPVGLSYQWKASGVAISGATTANLTVTSAQLGKTITVDVTGTKAGYTTQTKTSGTTSAVLPKPAAVHVSGSITTSTTWSSSAAATYVIDGDLTVATGATLTIAAGTSVTVAKGARITVNGILNAAGTSGSPAAFASSPIPAAAGDWYGFTVQAGGSLQLTHAVVKDTSTAVSGSGAVVIASSQISDSTYGVSVSSAPASITDSSVDGGIEVDRSSNFAERVNAITVTGNSVTDGPLILNSRNASTGVVDAVVKNNSVTGVKNTGTNQWRDQPTYPIQIIDRHLRPGNITGNTATGNESNGFGLGGTIVDSWTMPSIGMPYAVLGSDYDALVIAAGATVTVPAGTVIKVNDDGSGGIEKTGVQVLGALVAGGTASASVTFTSARDDSVIGDTDHDDGQYPAAAGDWYGFTVQAGGSLQLTHAVVKDTSTAVSGSGAVVIASSQISDSTYGVSVSSAPASITDSSVDGGIEVDRSSNFAERVNAITVTGNSVTDGPLILNSRNASTGVVDAVVKNNSVTGVKNTGTNQWRDQPTYPIQIIDRHLRPGNITGNTATGNESNGFGLGGTIVDSWTMPSIGMPYAVLGSDYDALVIAAGATVTVPAGTVIKVNDSSSSDPLGIQIAGSLALQGTASDPITLTSIHDDTAAGDTDNDNGAYPPGPGDWEGLMVGSGGTLRASNVLLRHAHVGVEAQGDPTSPATVEMDSTSLTKDATCVYASSGALGHFHGTVRDCGIGVHADSAFDATMIDWGSADGPGDATNGRPRLEGAGASAIPWVGLTLPDPKTLVAPKPSTTLCKDVLFIGVRGSGESGAGDGLGDTIRSLRDQYQAKALGMNPTFTLRTIGLDYPANAIPLVQDGTLQHVGDYVPGAWIGTVNLLETIEDETVRCGASGEKIVVTGYSQGAWVIHSAMAYAAQSGAVNLKSVAAIGLVADPQRLSYSRIHNTGSAPASSFGVANFGFVGGILYGFSQWIAGAQDPEVRDLSAHNVPIKNLLLPVDTPTSQENLSSQVCDNHDPVCANGTVPVADVHSRYRGTPELNEVAAQMADSSVSEP
ncbi:cutinase family protein [Amnibacterium endophyticum]|uniref:Cutinase family protein n=1 Tax=Amnibacterium endophyticum TaxID=2109337 RepID=A0ABW4LI93_9MICO